MTTDSDVALLEAFLMASLEALVVSCKSNALTLEEAIAEGRGYGVDDETIDLFTQAWDLFNPFPVENKEN